MKEMINPIVNCVGKSNDFVGIKVHKDNVEIFVPQVFRQEKDRRVNNRNLLKFLLSISLAKTIDKESIKKDDEVVGQFWPIDSYVWIINDYLANGYYYNREKIDTHDNKGKINWKKTIKTIPIYSDGNLIYDQLVTSRMSDSNDIIAQIYRLCLKISINRIGWAYNLNLYINAQQLKEKKEMLHLINKEMLSTFDDIKKMRFRHMLKILEGVNDDSALSDYHEFGIKNYYYVFETMVDNFFQGIKGSTKKDYNPFGEWKLLVNKGFQESTRLRPDTIHIHDNNITIIDAKMYQYGVTHLMSDLPGTSSIQKQITYGDFIKNRVLKDKNINIGNAFVMPYNKEIEWFKSNNCIDKYLDNNLVYIGTASATWRTSNEDYDHIHTFLIDYNYLLNNYNKKIDSYINTICSKIYNE